MAANATENNNQQLNNQQLIKSSDAARSLLLTRPWWNLCFVHGDQTKYYRQLYGKRRPIRTLQQQDLPNFCQCPPDESGNSTLQRKR